MACFKKIQNTLFGALVFLGSLVFCVPFTVFADDLSAAAVDYICYEPSQDVVLTPCLPGGWLIGEVKRSGCGNSVILKAGTFYRIGAKDYFLSAINCDGRQETNKKMSSVFFSDRQQDKQPCNWSHECMRIVSLQKLSRSLSNNFCQNSGALKYKKENVTYFIIEGLKQCSQTK